jgi:hypothetical protein
MKSLKLIVIAATVCLLAVLLPISAQAQEEQEIIDDYCQEVAREADHALFEIGEATADLQDCYDEYNDCMGGLHSSNPVDCIRDYRRCINRGNNEQLRECRRFLKGFQRDTRRAKRKARRKDVEDEFLDWFYSPDKEEECLSQAHNVALLCAGATSD